MNKIRTAEIEIRNRIWFQATLDVGLLGQATAILALALALPSLERADRRNDRGREQRMQ